LITVNHKSLGHQQNITYYMCGENVNTDEYIYILYILHLTNW